MPVETEHEDTSRPTLTELLRRAQNDGGRRDDAIEALLTRLYEPTLAFIRQRVRSWRDADDVAADVTQETMVRVAQSYSHCTALTDGAVMMWVLTTARHTLIDMWRSPSSGLAAEQLSDVIDGVIDGVGAPSISEYDSAGRRPAESLAREVLLRLAVQAYDDVSDEIGELLWHRLITGAEWAEVATHCRTTAAGAKRRFQRAQAALRKRIGALIESLPASERGAVRQLVCRYEQAGDTLARRSVVQDIVSRDAA